MALGGQRLIVQSSQHNERNIGGNRSRSTHGVQSMAIRQSHIQQHDVHAAFRKMN
jgi:hypothetical protein